MSEAIHEHLREVIRDHWGMTMNQLEKNTGMSRRVLRKTLDTMEAQFLIRHEGGRYVAR